MELETVELKQVLIEPFSIKHCLKCKGIRQIADVKPGRGILYLFVFCPKCNETLKVSLEIKWVEEVR